MFDLKQFLINEGLTRVSRERKVQVHRGKGLAHGYDVWKALPDALYHITLKSTWEQIQKDGYLGARYTKKFSDRSWQKIGIGTFFATNARSCQEYMSPDLIPGSRKELILLKVFKKDLNPDKIYLDGDVFGSKSVETMSDVSKSLWSIFYADKIPLQNVQVMKRISNKRNIGPEEKEQLTLKGIQTLKPFILEIGEKGGILMKERVDIPTQIEGLFKVDSGPIEGMSVGVSLADNNRVFLQVYLQEGSQDVNNIKDLLRKQGYQKCLECNPVSVGVSTFDEILNNPYMEWQDPDKLRLYTI